MRTRSAAMMLVGGLATVALLLAIVDSRNRHRVEREMARSDAELTALRQDLTQALLLIRQGPLGTAGTVGTLRGDRASLGGLSPGAAEARSAFIDEITQEVQREMGWLPIRVLRARRKSFVELYSYEEDGTSRYGTAGHLGGGFFITVKHGVVSLTQGPGDTPSPPRTIAIRIRYKGRDLPVSVVDAGNALREVDPGDWAIVKTDEAVDLPALPLDFSYPYEFGDPIFRLGNDYSKGIIPASGYIGQPTPNGLVTSLTDGHPGVSGGGILDRKGDLVGIPVGRMQGDFRFSFILPIRREMLRKVPQIRLVSPAAN